MTTDEKKPGLAWQNVPLPLFQGLSEGKDSHNIVNAGTSVSQNVSFGKDGSISTRRGYSGFSGPISGDNPSAWETSDGVRIVTSTGVYALTENSGVDIIETSPAPGYDAVDTYLGKGNRGSGHYRAVIVGNQLITVWHEPSTSTMAHFCYFGVYDADTLTSTQAPTLLTGTGEPTIHSDGTNVYICYMGTDTKEGVYVAKLQLASSVWSLDNEVHVSGSGIYETPRAYDFAFNGDDGWLICNYMPEFGVSTTDWGETELFHIGLSGTLSVDDTLTVTAAGAAPNTYSGTGLVMVAYSNNSPWFGVMCHTRNTIYTFTTNTDFSSVGSTVLAKDCSVTYGAGTINAPYVPSGTYRRKRGTRDPSSTSETPFSSTAGNRCYGYMTEDSPGSLTMCWSGVRILEVSFDEGNSADKDVEILGSCFATLGAVPAAVSNFQEAHSSVLTGNPVVVGSEQLVGLTWVGKWRYTFDETADLAVSEVFRCFEDPYTIRPGSAYGALPSSPLGSGYEPLAPSLLERPAYAVAFMSVRTNTAWDCVSPFGVDELFPVTDHWENKSEDGASENETKRLTDVVRHVANGGMVVYDGKPVAVSSRALSSDIDPFRGDILIYRATSPFWGHVGCITKFDGAQHGDGAFVGTKGVVTNGAVRAFSGDSLIDLSMYVPPEPVVGLGISEGSGSTTDEFNINFRFCWYWVDANGTKWRSPPSRAMKVALNSWDFDDDSVEMIIQPPPKTAAHRANKIGIEVYRNPTALDGSISDDGTWVLDSFRELEAGTSPFPFVYKTLKTPNNAPLLYTTGSVLPDEGPFPSRKIVAAAGRFWYTFGEKLYYSKDVSKDSPVGFNGNLYLDSPDGSAFTGVAHMDEQVVVFTRTGVFVARGSGPNNTGGGGGFILQQVSSPSGCTSFDSVVVTEFGVFFQGDRGMHLLERGMNVSYIGRGVEDSFGEDFVIDFSLYDRDRKEVLWFNAAGLGRAFDAQSGAWCTLTDTQLDTLDTGVWTSEFGTILVLGSTVSRESATPDTWPLLHSTPWIDVSQEDQGYQRAKRILIQGHTDSIDNKGDLTVRIYFDHEATAGITHIVPLYDGRTLDPFELKLSTGNRQKCKVFRVELDLPASDTDLTFTAINALAGYKPGGDKIRNS